MHLHAHGVIHRDIKPQNIFILEKNQLKVTLYPPNEKIGDFGEARRLKKGRTIKCNGQVFGSPFIWAPEIIKKKYYDFKVF